MKIRIGSKVKFLNDIGGGIVRGFKDDKMAIVETEDGFDMPVLVNDLIVQDDSSYGIDGEPVQDQERKTEKREESKKQISFEEKKYVSQKGEVLLALVPQNEQLLHVSDFDLYLINDSNYYFQYSVLIKDSSIATHHDTGIIEPDTKLEIGSFSQTELGKVDAFLLQGIYFKHGLSDVLPPLNQDFSIADVSFYKSNFFEANDYFHSKALILKKEEVDLREAIEKLKSGDISKVAKIKEAPEPKKESQSPKKKEDVEEVDLHIHEIIEDYKDMSNGEIIDAQLSRFETALETAINGNTRKIVFIHGVGNGKLKHELRKKLERKYPKLRYQDASFKEYGYGATMVYL